MSKQKIIDDNLNKIKALLSEGLPILSISKEIGVKYSTLIKYLKMYNIQYNTNQSKKGFSSKRSNCIDLQDVFSNKRPIASSVFRDRLIREGYKEHKCECCGNTEWLGGPIPLEIHHKNGNHYDNRLENIEVICSNCHSMRHGYGVNKNTEKRTIKETISYVNSISKSSTQHIRLCSVCGEEITKDAKTGKCQKCIHYDQRKTVWPTKDELVSLHSEKSNVQIGKIYGVSDNTVKRWLIYYNIQ